MRSAIKKTSVFFAQILSTLKILQFWRIYYINKSLLFENLFREIFAINCFLFAANSQVGGLV
jgi:hypothetical protein